MNLPANSTHTVIVGAGPYGLSLAAHLQQTGISFRIFGQPMRTWATQMPAGMHLRSEGFACNLFAGTGTYSFGQFCAETDRPYRDAGLPVPLQDFVAYGEEFSRRFVPGLEPESIRSVKRAESLFRVTTTSGEQIFAQRVVMATGLSLFSHVPNEFRRLPAGRVTHPSQHRSFAEFAGREVAVLGSGGSALNAAVLLHEAGARVTLIARSRKIRVEEAAQVSAHSPAARWLKPATPIGKGLRAKLACAAPGGLAMLPASARRLLFSGHMPATGDAALEGRLSGFPILPGCRVHAVEAADGSGDRLRITLTDSEGNVRQHLTSHLIAGTGYRIDLERLTVLCPSLRECIRVDREGAPKLNGALESSVAGLHFVGAAAAPAFGPLLQSIAGARFAAERVTRGIERSFARERRAAERASGVGVLAGPARERAL